MVNVGKYTIHGSYGILGFELAFYSGQSLAMANMSSETSPGLAAAPTFPRSFPEAQSFNVLLLTTDKKPVLSLPQASQDLVHEELPRWLRMSSLHVFIRPNKGNLVLIDADNFQGRLETLVSLQPSCLVETSKGNCRCG